MKTDINKELINNQYKLENINVLNRYVANKKELILCINVRSLNANYNKLLVFLNELEIKPCIIVCTETWNLQSYEYFNISGYKIYYNNSRINRSDGVVVYIKDNIIETTEILEINNLKIINSIISTDNNKDIVISSIYRSYDMHKTEFLMNIKKLIIHSRKYNNKIIIGDFNFNILNQNVLDQELLLVLLENGYCPGINDIIRPSDTNNNKSSCIDNFFIKLHKTEYNTYILNISFNDHCPIFMYIEKTWKIIFKCTKK